MTGKDLVGTVISNKMYKTVIIKLEFRVRNPLYTKIVAINKKCFVHAEGDKYALGSKVLIRPCRPLSKNKRWILVRQVKAQDVRLLNADPIRYSDYHDTMFGL